MKFEGGEQEVSIGKSHRDGNLMKNSNKNRLSSLGVDFLIFNNELICLIIKEYLFFF